jgi:hypothetical protein
MFKLRAATALAISVAVDSLPSFQGFCQLYSLAVHYDYYRKLIVPSKHGMVDLLLN